ncbi:putative cobalt transport ATP-binding protein [Yersinia thracica]|uniref:Putative cobalt transport ATP-binding protein n=1 Tax=Yersinia thracica TaxID=2890319 RepID=A0A0T9PN65_9GAMM|nr:putative cobalt transport ATP-binding protein [Yersinia thracica]
MAGYEVLSHGHLMIAGETTEVFLQQDKLQAARLVQPWLVKMHTELGLPRCKTEEQLFALMRQRETEEV